MKICFLVGTLGQGGAERQLYYYLQALKECNVETYVLSATIGEYWEEKIAAIGVPVKWVGRHPGFINRLFAIYREIKKNPVDIIYSQHFHMNLYAFLVARMLKVKDVGSLRNNVYSEIETVPVVGRFCLYFPKYLVANSKAAVENAVILGRKPCNLFYLPNYVDYQFYQPVVRKSRENIIVSFVGTIKRQKRVDRIIRLAKKCLDDRRKIQFRIYGDGYGDRSHLEEMKRLAIHLGVLGNNLEFMGRVLDPLVAYHESDIFLLTSDYEGTPNVVLEAMACGLPIVSTNVGDLPNIIEPQFNGFLVDREDEEGLYNSLLMLYENPSLRERMGFQNRQKITSQRSIKRLSRDLIDLFNTICG